jgi:hypothetical protein
MSEPPLEPRGGQDDAPDTRTAVRAVLRLLEDVTHYMEERPAPPKDLLLRVYAHRSALNRLRRRLDGGEEP